MDVQIHVFLISALVGGEWSASRPDRFTPGAHYIGGCVEPRASLDDVEKRSLKCMRLKYEVFVSGFR
jgi:hypothetical protein